MRELKFRAWVIRSESAIDINKMRYENNQTVFEWEADGVSMEIMQFTGLKDKNGKEIYEGDILSHTDDGVFQVVYVEELAMFKRLFGDGQRLEFMRLTAPRFCEVIGNIFENPDLINPFNQDERE